LKRNTAQRKKKRRQTEGIPRGDYKFVKGSGEKKMSFKAGDVEKTEKNGANIQKRGRFKGRRKKGRRKRDLLKIQNPKSVTEKKDGVKALISSRGRR